MPSWLSWNDTSVDTEYRFFGIWFRSKTCVHGAGFYTGFLGVVFDRHPDECGSECSDNNNEEEVIR